MRGTAYLELLASPVLDAKEFGGRPVYTSHLVVQQDSSFIDAATLRSATVAYNDAMSLSGYHILHMWLSKLGEDTAFFGEWLASGGHEKSAELIAAGVADVAAIDVGVWLRLQRDRPELAKKLRVLGADCQLPHVPIQPFVAASRLAESTKAAIRGALLQLGAGEDMEATGAAAAGSMDATTSVGDAGVSSGWLERHMEECKTDAVGGVIVTDGVGVHMDAGARSLRTMFMKGFTRVDDEFYDSLRAQLADVRVPAAETPTAPSAAQLELDVTVVRAG